MKATWTLLRAEWDRALGVILIVIGAVALFLGYQGVADSIFVGQQMAYVVSGGLGGLFLGAVGVGLLVSADLHDEWRKLDRIEGAILGEGQDKSWVPPPAPEGHGVASPRKVPPVSMFVKAGPALTLRRGFTSAWIAVMAASGVLALAWSRTADSRDVPSGAPWIAVGAGGVAAGLLGIAGYPLWLRVRLAARKRRLFRGWLLRSLSLEEQALRLGEQPTVGFDLVMAKESRRIHFTGCPVLRGLQTTAVPLTELDPSLERCRICQPS